VQDSVAVVRPDPPHKRTHTSTHTSTLTHTADWARTLQDRYRRVLRTPSSPAQSSRMLGAMGLAQVRRNTATTLLGRLPACRWAALYFELNACTESSLTSSDEVAAGRARQVPPR
jgi:hypothetical protein